MLTHMMRRPHYPAAFRAETAPAFRGDVLVDLNRIQNPPPMLEADVRRPVLGIISVKGGQDYDVRITKR